MKEKNMKQFLDVLEKNGPLSEKQIRARLHLTHEPTGRRIREARAAGLIHACGYTTPTQKGEHSIRIWALGPSPDEDLDDEIDGGIERQSRIAAVSADTVPFRDPFIAAFFGPAA